MCRIHRHRVPSVGIGLNADSLDHQTPLTVKDCIDDHRSHGNSWHRVAVLVGNSAGQHGHRDKFNLYTGQMLAGSDGNGIRRSRVHRGIRWAQDRIAWRVIGVSGQHSVCSRVDAIDGESTQ